jgi:hypothetical protein
MKSSNGKSKRITPKPGKTYGTMGYGMQMPLKQGSKGVSGDLKVRQAGVLKK